jgi:tetratricopeptide (TPR) repeat protein
VLGSIALAQGAYDEAQESLRKSVAVFRETQRREDMGLALAVLACAARGLGQLPRARQSLHEALQIGFAIHGFRPCLYALCALSLVLADEGATEQAVELYALVSRHPHVANSCWFEDVAGVHIATAATALPPDAVATAQERGRARDLWATAEELLAELEEL